MNISFKDRQNRLNLKHLFIKTRRSKIQVAQLHYRSRAAWIFILMLTLYNLCFI